MPDPRPRLGAISVCLLLGGCGAATPPQAAVAPRAVAGSACDDLLVRYRAALAERDDGCASDADCAIYGGVDPDDVCGGATGVETARALAALSEDMSAAGCPRPGYSCPPIPRRCAQGSCR